MVFESVSADVAVCGERWRVFDAEFYSDAGDDDFGIDRGAMVAGCDADDSVQEIVDCGSRVSGGGIDFARGRNLSDCEADLDAELDTIQRRALLSVYSGVLVGDRREGISQVGVSAAGDRDEFDGGVSDRTFVAEFHNVHIQHSSGGELFCVCGGWVAAIF